MKNTTIAILIVVTLICSGLYVHQAQKTSQTEATVASLQQKIGELEKRVTQQKKQAVELHTQLQNAQAEVVASAEQATQFEQSMTNHGPASAPTNAKPTNLMAEMFKKPEMKELIKTQQKAVFGPMIDKNYAKLSADLQLTAEQSDTLKALLIKKMLVDADVGVSMMSGDVDASKRAEMVQQAKADKETIDGQIKQLLGEENYPQFQSYEKTIPERMAVSTFKDQLASGPTALTSDQEEHLVQAMSDERQNFKFTTDYLDQSKFDGDFSTYFSPDRLNKFQQEMEQLDQRYVSRAQSILSSDQIGAFGKFLTSQREMQTAAMQMASKMFAPKEGGNQQ